MRKLKLRAAAMALAAAVCLSLLPGMSEAAPVLEEAGNGASSEENVSVSEEAAIPEEGAELEDPAEAEEPASLPEAAAESGPIAEADFNDGRMHWSVSREGVLTLSGTGDTPDYGESVNAPWYPYRSQITGAVVEDGITGLGSYAFYGLNSMETVELPGALVSLGESCFQGCSSLQAIDLPAGLTRLPDSAFYGCRSLRSIVIPEGVASLGEFQLFRDCNALKSITLPSTLQRLGSGSWGTFLGTSITDIYYNGTLSQWLSISFLDSLPMQSPCNLYIGGEKLTNLDVPTDVERIPNNAFQYVNLSSVTLPYRVKSIGDSAFYNSSVASVRMTDSVTSVGTNAFANCSALKKVYFAGDQAKWSAIAWNTGNDALIDAERQFVSSLGDDVRTVSAGQVEHGTLTLSDAYCVAGDVITVTALPEPGWRLKRILVNGTEITGNRFTAEADTDYVVTAEFEFYRNVKAHGTCGTDLTWYLYENDELAINGTGAMSWSGNSPWYDYRNAIRTIVINKGVTSIEDGAFINCTLVESVALPDSVERIESSAFQNCSALTRVDLPRGLNYIGYYSFYDCPLEEVYYPGTIAGWLSIEFDGSNRDHGLPQAETQKLYINGDLVENLVIPENITNIPAYAFYDYSGLVSVEFLGDAPSVGENAFARPSSNSGTVLYYHAGTAGWTSPVWNGYTAAQIDAFSDYSALDGENRNAQGILFTLNDAARTAVVGDGSSKENNAGYYGAQRGAVVIPDTVTRDGKAYQVIGIGPNAFSRNRHVTGVSIGAGVSSVIPSAFAGCPNLEAFTVSPGNGYYAARDGVLYDVSGLYLYVYPGGKAGESFTVPASVKTIGVGAFYDNEHLRSLTVGRNVTAIYSGAFCGLTNLESITLPFIGTRERNSDDSYSYSEHFADVFGDGYYGKNCIGRYSYEANTNVEGSLKKVSITGGTLSGRAFSECGSIQEIALASVPEEIPYECFHACNSLEKIAFAGQTCEAGQLVLPEGVKTVEDNAFAGCGAITFASLPASLTGIASSAFSGAGLEEFSVAAGNRSYSTDSWGVLYSYDKTRLVQYPACRRWPYYNVAASARSIGNRAFSGCKTLVNLYVPNTVTTIDRGAVTDCPNLTLCCFTGSAACSYALDNRLTAWYMDNRTLQGIRIYSLPEQTSQVQGRVDLQGLYVVGSYGGRELQIDDYTLDYDQRTPGPKTVTVTYQGRTVTFQMVLYPSSAGNIIDFRCEEAELDGKRVLIAVYDSGGAMLLTGEAVITGGQAQLGVSDSVFQRADHAKLFVMDSETFAPTAGAQRTEL